MLLLLELPLFYYIYKVKIKKCLTNENKQKNLKFKSLKHKKDSLNYAGGIKDVVFVKIFHPAHWKNLLL